MDINDIYKCAEFYKNKFVERFYIITTFSGSSFILVAESSNLPHLIGIKKQNMWATPHKSSKDLYKSLINHDEISPLLIQSPISSRSNIYKKAKNFEKMDQLLIKNKRPILIKYDPKKCDGRLKSINYLLWDSLSGYMIGMTSNKSVPISGSISIHSYCLSTWMDRSEKQNKEFPYSKDQDIDLVRHVYVFDGDTQLLQHKKYNYDRSEKKEIIEMCARDGNNLILDKANLHNYITIAKEESIHCKLNGKYYDDSK